MASHSMQRTAIFIITRSPVTRFTGSRQVFSPDEKLGESDLESKVENVGQTPAPDGMLEAPDGSIYLTDLEHNAIVHWNPATKSIEQVIADKRLHVARHVELGTKRRTLRHRIADREHAAFQQRQIHAF